VDPSQPIDNVKPIGELLACTGIYGVTAYLVSERTREIAIRLALGAAPRGVLRQLVSEGTRWIAGGAAAGLALAWGIAVLVGGKVPEVAGTSLTTYLATGLLLTTIGVVATTLPTMRAMNVPPAEVLRGE
jgi:putative ABC transport system permease protein